MPAQSPYLDYRARLRTLDPPARRPDTGPLLDAAFGNDAPALKAQIAEALHYFSDVDLARPDVLHGAVPDKVEAAGPTWPDAAPGVAWPPAEPTGTAVVAVLDEGLPFADRRLAGRFASVWVQAAMPEGTPGPLPFGAAFTGDKVQAALGAQPGGLVGDRELYRRFGAMDATAPHRMHMERHQSHGALVLSALDETFQVAVKASQAGSTPALADPQLPLVGVSFPPRAVRDTSGGLLPYFAICGLLHVIAVARALGKQAKAELPVVVNFSYGVLAGAKDGSGVFEAVLNALGDPALTLPDLGPIHIVVPMGNGRLSEAIARLPAAKAEQAITLRLLPDDRTATYVEIRGAPRFDLRAPGGASWQAWTDDPTRPVTRFPDRIEVHRFGTGATPAALLAFPPTASVHPDMPLVQCGAWTLRFPAGAAVELAMQRDDALDGLGSGGRQARFSDPAYALYDAQGRLVEYDPPGSPSPVTRNGTWNAFAAGPHIWSVGGRFDRPRKPVPYSGLTVTAGAGTRQEVTDGSRVMPGRRMRTLAGGAMRRATGTSLAAPQTAAKLALILAGFTGVSAPKRRDRTALNDALDALDKQLETMETPGVR